MTSGPLTSPLLMGEGLGRYYPSTRGDSYGGEEVVSFTTATLQEQPPILFTHARTHKHMRVRTQVGEQLVGERGFSGSGKEIREGNEYT